MIAAGHGDEPIHPQVHIEHGDLQADIDEEIAPLILDLWRLGIVTSMSCQDNDGAGGGGRIWIALPAYDAERFLNVVAGEHDDDVESLYNRIVHQWEPDDWEAFRAERAWRYAASVVDLNVREEGDPDSDDWRMTPIGPPDFMVDVLVRFPRSDLPEVTRRVRARPSDSDEAQ